MNSLVLFGSKSDEAIYSQLNKSLTDMGDKVEFYVLSAHRNPEELTRVLKTSQYDRVIAGAGLSAHLPGVVAAHTIKPVYGIPVSSQLDGLDSFYSVSQMPFGVPVLSTHSNDISTLISFLKSTGEPRQIHFVVDSRVENTHKSYVGALELIEKYHLPVDICSEEQNSGVNIVWGRKPMNANSLFVPYLDHSKKNLATESLTIFEQTRGTLSVGINNPRNGLLFGLQMINNNSQYNEVLHNVRKV